MASPDQAEPTASTPGLIRSLRAYLSTWVDLLKTRLHLLANELEEEEERIQQILVLGATAVLCLVIGSLLVTCFIVVLFWETNYRLIVLGGFALFYLIIGGIAGLITLRKSRQRPRLLSATLGELAKDHQRLSS